MNEHKPKPTKETAKKMDLRSLKKPLIAGGIIAVIAIAGIITGLYFLGAEDETPEKDTLVISVVRGP